jgi:plasmid stabilization system protein ParE
MAYEIIWLDEARKSLDAEMEYVYSNFGLLTLSEVYDDLHERVNQLKLFPRIGVRHEDLDYHGYEMRMLHVKRVSVVYAIIGQTVQILYVWNNRQDPKRIAKVLGLEE